MVTKVDAFMTTDGTLFISELEAYKHECSYLEKTRTTLPKYDRPHDFITKTNIEVEYIQYYQREKPVTVLNVYPPHIGKYPEHKPGVYMWFDTIQRMGYVGSAEDCFRRCSDFFRKSGPYAGKKLEVVRKERKYDFVYLLLEKIDDVEKLIGRENYYIEKYDTINNGYNTKLAHKPPNPHKDEDYIIMDKKERQRITCAKSTYKTLINHIGEWDLKVGDTLTLENFVDNYEVSDVHNNSLDKTLSFRLSCFLKNKDTVELEDLLPLGIRVKMLLDKAHCGFKSLDDTFPSFMVRYRQSDGKYSSVNDPNGTTFNNVNDAISFYIEENIRKKLLVYLENNEELISVVKNMSVEDLIKLKFKDSDKVIDFIHNGYCKMRAAS